VTKKETSPEKPQKNIPLWRVTYAKILWLRMTGQKGRMEKIKRTKEEGKGGRRGRGREGN
jgi:hypothetical protein